MSARSSLMLFRLPSLSAFEDRKIPFILAVAREHTICFTKIFTQEQITFDSVDLIDSPTPSPLYMRQRAHGKALEAKWNKKKSSEFFSKWRFKTRASVTHMSFGMVLL